MPKKLKSVEGGHCASAARYVVEEEGAGHCLVEKTCNKNGNALNVAFVFLLHDLLRKKKVLANAKWKNRAKNGNPLNMAFVFLQHDLLRKKKVLVNA